LLIRRADVPEELLVERMDGACHHRMKIRREAIGYVSLEAEHVERSQEKGENIRDLNGSSARHYVGAVEGVPGWKNAKSK
jgi:hypothetical protein